MTAKAASSESGQRFVFIRYLGGGAQGGSCRTTRHCTLLETVQAVGAEQGAGGGSRTIVDINKWALIARGRSVERVLRRDERVLAWPKSRGD